MRVERVMSRRRGQDGRAPAEPVPSAEELFHQFEIRLGKAVLAANRENLEALHMLGNALTRTGRHEDALGVDREIVRLCPHDPVSHYNLACSYSNLKEIDHALRSLDEALNLGYRDIAHLMSDGDLAAVRKDPRFREFVERKWGKRRARRRRPK